MDAGLKKVLIGMAAGALGMAMVGCGGDSAEAAEDPAGGGTEESTVGGEASCGAGSCGGEAGGMDDMGGGDMGGDDMGGEEGGEAACGAGSCGGEE